MMSWQTIKNKYPLAYQKAYEYGFFIELDEGGIIEMCYDMTFRDLYDFFDENNIIINIFNSENGFSFSIPGIDGFGFDSRQQAEEQAFIKAFEILEKDK